MGDFLTNFPIKLKVLPKFKTVGFHIEIARMDNLRTFKNISAEVHKYY
jgi:hypothetical protein